MYTTFAKLENSFANRLMKFAKTLKTPKFLIIPGIFTRCRSCELEFVQKWSHVFLNLRLRFSNFETLIADPTFFTFDLDLIKTGPKRLKMVKKGQIKPHYFYRQSLST